MGRSPAVTSCPARAARHGTPIMYWGTFPFGSMVEENFW